MQPAMSLSLVKRLRNYIRHSGTGKLLLILFGTGILPPLLMRLFRGENKAGVTFAVMWLCFMWGWAGLLIFKRRATREFVTPVGLLIIIVAIMFSVLCWGMSLYSLVLGLWHVFTP